MKLRQISNSADKTICKKVKDVTSIRREYRRQIKEGTQTKTKKLNSKLKNKLML